MSDNCLSVDLDSCHIGEHGGFLKYRCSNDRWGGERYKCHASEEFYYLGTKFWPYKHGQICSEDPYFYQACDRRVEGYSITNRDSEDTLCGNQMCEFYQKGSDSVVTLTDLATLGWVCDGVQDCTNTDLDETGCSNTTTLPTGLVVQSKFVCNDRCEVEDCQDEAICNGLTYGMYCTYNGELVYLYPDSICNGGRDCDDKADEVNCTVSEKTRNKCVQSYSKSVVPIHNFTRCMTLNYFSEYKYYCTDMKEAQTNCTDPARVGATCNINGFKSTVSKYMICAVAVGVSVCDDRIESDCLNISKSCYTHKHMMCDNKRFCDDNADELHPICLSQTNNTCQRKVGEAGELTLPLTWLNDGVQDCIDGSDELAVWPTCGRGKTYRLVTSNTTCENVFVCLLEDNGYVELNQLCDGLETCGNENKICSLSRSSQTISTSVSSTKNGFLKELAHCMKGLRSIASLDKVNCVKELFIFPDHEYFGVSNKTELHLRNDSNQNCDHMYGEQYVFTSCRNRCANSSCPLKNQPRYEVCPDQYPDRIGTIANKQYLAFFTKSQGNIYTNRYFVCDNKIRCIDYSQVCDLVDDCGDASDEKSCTNHFKCSSSVRFIPKSSKCDDNFDCLDKSDECNEQCSRQILETSFLKVTTWLLGGLALTTNLIIIIRNIGALKRCKTVVALNNKSLIILISFGDLLVGCYLLVVATYDTIIFGKTYCRNQIEWMTSYQCSTIGVLGTIGSQVSLFSMVGLSVVRLNGIRQSFRAPGEVSRGKCLRVVLGVSFIFTISATIAILPTISGLEDYFVNGLKFPDQLQLFIGAPNKQNTLPVIEAYYGRMKETTLSWEMIINMMRNMFSHDFGYDDHTLMVTKLDFYGNDGVCLFKYFVKKVDPQKYFVWFNLAVNLICFLFITSSYILIGLVSRNSSKTLASSLANNNLNKRNRKTNRKISVIITTDFCCWVPFIVICALHSLEVLDATPWYGIFSMIILPINSVINPLLYDDVVAGLLKARFHMISGKIVNSAIYLSVNYKSKPEVHEMDEINIQIDASGADSGVGKDKNIIKNNEVDIEKGIDKDKEKDIDKDLDDSDSSYRGGVSRDRNVSYVNKVAVGLKTRNRNEESHGNGSAVKAAVDDGVPTEINGTVTVEVHIQEDQRIKVMHNPTQNTTMSN